MGEAAKRVAAILATEARKSGLPDAAVNQFTAATTRLLAAAVGPDLAEFRTALDGWRARLEQLSPPVGDIPAGIPLMLSALRRPLPPVPGLDTLLDAPSHSGLAQLLAYRDGLRRMASLGPLALGTDIAAATLRHAPPGALPDPDVVLGLLPPTGMALGLGTGPVSGGGSLSFTETPHPRLSGSFGLRMGPVAISAFGIVEWIDTLSVAVLLAARFTPGIQLSFGFAITAVGGLVGINRRADTDALRSRLASGSAADALFAGDPKRNAPAVLATLGELFPPSPGSHVVGPTVELSWLKLGPLSFLTVSLGVFLQLPEIKVVIVGTAVAEVPPKDAPMLHLRVDVLGEVDPARKLIAVDAVLVDSYALGIFRVGGGAAFRLCWGDPPYAVLTVGGFYPGFNPAPAVIPPVSRVSLTPYFDFLPGFYFRAEGYLAATTNTFQVGGAFEAGIDIGLSARGHLSLDAIFQFDPFHFEVDVAGGFSVHAPIIGTVAGVEVGGG